MDLEQPKVDHYQFRIRWHGRIGECTGRTLQGSKHMRLEIKVQTTEGFLKFEVVEVENLATAWPLLHTACEYRGVHVLEYRTTDGRFGPWTPVPGAPVLKTA